MLKTPKNHHYVWAHYLTSWAQPNSKEVWHETSKGKTACDSVVGLSREHGYNKVARLRKIDIEFINLWPKGGSQALQNFHTRQLNFFLNSSQLIGCHEGKEGTPDYAKLKEISDHVEYSLFEHTHTIIEKHARPLLDELKSGNRDILKVKGNTANFCNFLAQQLFRTKKIKETCLNWVRTLEADTPAVDSFRELYERNWWLLSYRLATNVGSSLTHSAASDSYVFIENSSVIDFVTSDCPVVNIHEPISTYGPHKPPSRLDLYFPITPKLACIISPDGKYNHLGTAISEGEVEHLNRKMTLNSYHTVYATSKEAIDKARAYKLSLLRSKSN